jgi:hypothetical protein
MLGEQIPEILVPTAKVRVVDRLLRCAKDRENPIPDTGGAIGIN